MTATASKATLNGKPPLTLVDGGIVILPLSQVEHDPSNYRVDWDSSAAVATLRQLADQILDNGYLTRYAPAVYQIAPNKYRVNDGNRRFAAMQLLHREKQPIPRGTGLDPYPLGFGPFTIVSGSDQKLRIEGLLANTARRDLNVMEEAIAYSDVLLNGVPFRTSSETVYATLTPDELTLVTSMAGVMAADVEERLNVKSRFQDWRLDRLTVGKIVRQMMKTCSSITKLDSMVKRLALLNLIEDVQQLVSKGQMTLDFAEALAALDRNHQFKAIEKWSASGGKMDLRTWQAMCLALAEDQAASAQLSLFDDSFWQTQAIESAVDEKRKRKGRKYGLDADPHMMAALDGIKVTRSLPNTDTAMALMAEQLRRNGQSDLARMLNAVREKLLSDYFTNPADPATVLAFMQKED